jgi:hypothetical protein
LNESREVKVTDNPERENATDNEEREKNRVLFGVIQKIQPRANSMSQEREDTVDLNGSACFI